MDQVCRALSGTDAVKKFELSFRRRTGTDLGEGGEDLVITRTTPWKRLLAFDDLPLKVWSLIPFETRAWNGQTSHSSLDALFLLMREKSAVLLQNVKRQS